MVGHERARVDPSNAEQARAWDGDTGAYWAVHAERFENSVARYTPRILDAAQIDATAQVLDIGCGTGETTCAAARLAISGEALGVDLSSRMIQVARERSQRAGITNARFEQGDAQIHPFPQESFDVAISRTGAMFFGDPDAAFSNIARALRRSGVLVLLVWQGLRDNEWMLAIRTALAAGRSLPSPPPGAPGPFSMSDSNRVRVLLTGAGFRDPRVESVSEAMHLGDGPDDAFDFLLGLAGWMLDGLDDSARVGALDELRATIDRHDGDEGVLFGSAAWLVTTTRPD